MVAAAVVVVMAFSSTIQKDSLKFHHLEKIIHTTQ